MADCVCETNERIADLLEQVVQQYQTDPSKKFQLKALNKGIASIREHSEEITSGKYASEHLDGVGTGIAKRIDEILSTGTLAELGGGEGGGGGGGAMSELMQITGIGPKKAANLIKEGICSIVDLRKAAEEKRVKLTHHSVVGLRYYEDFLQRIPRAEVDAAFEVLNEQIGKLNCGAIFELCGSYRRGAATCGDIDVLITIPGSDNEVFADFKRLIKNMTRAGFLIDNLTEDGGKKYMGVCRVDRLARRIDIRYVPWSAFFPALIYFTGSKNFNIEMRLRALQRGFHLSEYGLTRIGSTELITVSAEEEIFSLLGETYVLPTDREM